MIVHFSDLSSSACYFAMTQVLIPRPIAWVLTENHHHNFNLAPFSFFTGICSDPPIVMISAGKKSEDAEKGMPKDTRKNILEKKAFVIHIPSPDDLTSVNASDKSWPYGQS